MASIERPKHDGPFAYKVNGIQLDSKTEKLLAKEILEAAKQAGAMPGKPEDYALQGDKGRFLDNELVDLEEDNVFITIPITPTPVA